MRKELSDHVTNMETYGRGHGEDKGRLDTCAVLNGRVSWSSSSKGETPSLTFDVQVIATSDMADVPQH